MKAFFITGAGKWQVGEIAVPRPGPDEVLLRTRIVGMCGSDLNTFRGKNPMVSYPRIPGHEIAATVEETGAMFRGRFPRGNGRDGLALHELRNVRLLPAGPSECMPVKPDAWRAARWRHDEIFRRSVAETLRG